MENQPEDKEYTKPGYDGRLNFHKLLYDNMVSIAIAMQNDNLQAWANLLRGFYSLAQPFIDQKDAQLSKEQITICENNINLCMQKAPIDESFKTICRNQIRQATEDMYYRSRHLFLPVKTESEQTFNEKDFLEGSDL